jgi:hypothetical protein
MCILDRPAHVRRIFNGLLAMVLAFTCLGRVHASSETPEEAERYKNHESGIVNATFGLNNTCLLDAWTAAGSVTTVPTGFSDCKAVLSADNSTADRPAAVTTRLEQSFVVQGNSTKVRFYAERTSNNPNTTFAAQTITLYNKSGGIIARQVLNAQSSSYFEAYLNGYAGDTVRLSIEVNLDPTRAGSPSKASMSVDFRMMYSGPQPELPGGGGL